MSALPRVRRGERWTTILFHAGIAVLWIGALAAANGHGGAAAPTHSHASLHEHAAVSAGVPGLLALLAMWITMMVAMMVPPELPALASQFRPRSGRTSVARAATFFGGLLAAWTAFGAVAALGHWELERRVLTDAGGVLASPAVGAVLLGTIGAFQLTPLKRRCLERCRADREALPSRPGAGGAFVAGLRHGVVSLGSCALLMLLPLGFGGMSLVTMAAITCLLVVEKLSRRGLLLGRVAGAALVVWSAVAMAGGG